jgi:mono/diheme cytochrome c family protein
MNRSLARIACTSLCLFAGLFLAVLPVRAQDDAASVFKSKCAGCHGPDGTGSTAAGKAMKIRDFHSADVQKQTDAELTEIVTTGKSPMPGYKGKLTDDQIKQLVGYVRELGKK